MRDDRELQLDWDFRPLHDAWPAGPDSAYMMRRLAAVPVEATAAGASGRLLEVAAAEAVHACRLNRLGLTSVVLEPSMAMLGLARQRMREHGAALELVRGVCETLPFRDASFDRVLCDSAIDHFADPAEGVREMARVLRPGGRLVISANNYAGVAVRVSRALYRLARLLRLPGSERHFFWDTPVPAEHTFECTFARLEQLCGPHLELDHAFGVSLGGMAPGWGALLARLPAGWAQALLERLDRVAFRAPRAADFMVTVWRPRADGRLAPRASVAATGYVVAPDDLVYPAQAQREAHWAALA
ncbi:MAG: class I SAM-dependent methyltransferase, partial [Candidatus Binatia bacterium]